MRNLNSITKHIRSHYPDAHVVQHADDTLTVTLPLNGTDRGWADVYDELEADFTRDSDIRKAYGVFCVGLRDVPNHFGFAFTFYRTH